MSDENTLHDDLSAAFDAVSEPAAPAPESSPPPVESSAGEPPPTSEATSQTAEGRARDEKGRFKKAQEEAAAKAAAAATPAAPPAQAATPPATEQPASQPTQIPKAPQSWRPAAREEWAKIPPSIRDEVMRREKEVTQALQESSEARQGYQRFREAIAPFEQMVRAEGAEPLQAIQGLFQTAYALRHAPVQTKAQMIANMVKAYLPGREGLELLDATLAGQPVQPGQPGQPQEIRDPRLDAFLAQFQQAQRQREQTQTQRAAKLVEEISKEEFYEDVRLDMADIMEMSQRRGLDMTLRDAYNRAVAMNPELSKVMAQREAAKRASTQQQGATQRGKVTSSSLKSSPAPKTDVGGDQDDIRSSLAAAMEAHQR